jgi:hypothetical protein
MIKARDLKRGDYFTAQVHCEVIEVVSVAGGERIKVVAAVINPHSRSVEYLDEGSVLALVCKPGRQFSVGGRRRDGGGGGDDDVVGNPPDPGKLVDA